MTTGSDSRSPARFAWLGLAPLAGLIFFPGLFLGFMADDFNLMDLAVNQPFDPLDPFPAGSGGYYRPMIIASLSLTNWVAASTAPFAHHLVNLSAHLGCALLIYRHGRLFFSGYSAPLAAAALFTVHPANLTNVFWISGRTDVLCTLFFLAGLNGFVRYMREGQNWRLAVMILCWLGAVASKESGLVFVGVCTVWLALMALSNNDRSCLKKERALASLMILSLLTLFYLLFLFVFFYKDNPERMNPTGLAHVPVNLFKSLFYAVSPVRPDVIRAQLAWLAVGVAIAASAGLAYYLKTLGPRAWRMTPLLALGVMLPLLPVMIMLNGAAGRFLYLSLALSGCGISLWTSAFPQSTTKISALIFAATVIMIWATGSRARVWVHNQVLITACTESFRKIADPNRPEQLLVFLTAPGIFRDEFVFSNDLNPALFHALYDRFGRFANCSELGMIVYDDLNYQIQKEDDPSVYRFSREIDGDAYFHFGGGAREGQAFSFGGGRTELLDDRGPGKITKFVFTVQPDFQDREPLILDFDGESFVRVDLSH